MDTSTAESTGHRSRLLERFRRGGLQGLHDYEILELILTFAIPRKDTKPLAKELLRGFKSLSAVLNADPLELARFDGIGDRTAALFSLMKEVMAYCLRERYEQKSVIAHRRDVEEYLRFHFGQRHAEYVAVVYLDNANCALSTDIVAEGTSNQCAVYPRTIIERALRHKATSFILAHNHPGGSTSPSEADWQITRRLFQAGKLLEMPLVDHIIISKEQVISLKDHPQWPRQ